MRSARERGRKRGRRKGALAVMLVCLVVGGAAADTYVQVESTVLGGGWFKYRLQMEYHAYFARINDVSLCPFFTNLVEYGSAPPGWQDTTNSLPWSAEWKHSNDIPRYVEGEFFVRSSETGIRTNWVLVLFSGDPLERYDVVGGGCVYSRNIVCYIRLDGLGPCPLRESDTTATNLLDRMVLIPDPEVVDMSADSLTFAWPSDCTVKIEASEDYVNWTNIAFAMGYPTNTTWTAPAPLPTYGNAFRVVLVSEQRQTNLVTGGTSGAGGAVALAGPAEEAVRVAQQRPVGTDALEVVVETVPGDAYRVSLVTVAGEALSSTTFVASGDRQTVRLTVGTDTGPVFVRAVRLNVSTAPEQVGEERTAVADAPLEMESSTDVTAASGVTSPWGEILRTNGWCRWEVPVPSEGDVGAVGMKLIDGKRFLAWYHDKSQRSPWPRDAKLIVRIGTITRSGVKWGPETVAYDGPFLCSSVLFPDKDTVIMGGKSRSEFKARVIVGAIDGSEITWSSGGELSDWYVYSVRMHAFGGNRLLAAYYESEPAMPGFIPTYCLGRRVGSGIQWGNECRTDMTSDPEATLVLGTSVVIRARNGYVWAATIQNDGITWGPAVKYTSMTYLGEVHLHALDDSRFLVAHNGYLGGSARIGRVEKGRIILGEEVPYNNGYTREAFSSCLIRKDRLMICYRGEEGVYNLAAFPRRVRYGRIRGLNLKWGDPVDVPFIQGVGLFDRRGRQKKFPFLGWRGDYGKFYLFSGPPHL